MLAWIEDVLPIVGIGIIFGMAYELVLFIQTKLSEKDKNSPKNEIKLEVIKPKLTAKEEFIA